MKHHTSVSTRIIELSGALNFGPVAIGSTGTGTLTIHNAGNHFLTVDTVRYPVGFSGQAWGGVIQAGESQDITVTFTPTEGITYDDYITVVSDNTAGSEVRAVTGMGSTRVLSASGASLFGNVAVGGSKTDTVYLFNAGNTALVISAVAYPEGFSCAWAGGTLAPSQLLPIQVTFAPVDFVSYGGDITFTSDRTGGVGTFAISGVGTLESDAFKFSYTSQGAVVLGYTNPPVGALTVPSATEHLGTVYPVVAIGAFAFQNRTALTVLNMPASIQAIGEGAFQGCAALTSCTIPDGVVGINNYAFMYCVRLASVTIPTSVTYIGDNAFAGCGRLANVVLPPLLSGMGPNAFQDCTSLTAIKIPGTLTAVPNSAFQGCSNVADITLNTGTTAIGTFTFSGCPITSINIPGSVVTVGNSAFSACAALAVAKFLGKAPSTFGSSVFSGAASGFKILYSEAPPDVSGFTSPTWNGYTCTRLGYFTFALSGASAKVTGYTLNAGQSALGALETPATWNGYPVTSIGWQAFVNQQTLTTMIIPEGVTRLEDQCFFNCNWLVSVKLPSTVTYIGFQAFYSCFVLADVALPENLYELGQSAFYYCAMTSAVVPASLQICGTNIFQHCYNLTTAVIKSAVVGGCDYMFWESASLTSVTFDCALAKMPNHGVGGCTALQAIVLPSTVWDVGYHAFNGCTKLAQLTLPAAVTRVQEGAFMNWTQTFPVAIYFLGNAPTTVGAYIFTGSNTSNVRIYVTPTATGWGSTWQGVEVVQRTPEFTYTVSNGNATITGHETSVGNLEIPAAIAGHPVVAVKASAFAAKTGLTGITIPSSVTSIGAHAFEGCATLTSVNLVTGLLSIGDRAFYQCSSLPTITIPSSVTSIGSSVFSKCANLAAIEVDGSNTIFSSDSGVLLNKSQTELIQYPLNKHGMTLYTLPATVVSIDAGAFSDSNVTSVILPEGLTTIGDAAFSDSALAGTIILPSTLLTIGSAVFANCQSMLHVTIPNGVAGIGADAFIGTGLTGVIVPSSVAAIGARAFEGCVDLTNVVFPESGALRTIGDSAFYGCLSLTIAEIPAGTLTIGAQAFAGCPLMASATVPASVTSIGRFAFQGASLASITVDAANNYYAGVDGVLFDKAMVTLIHYPEAKADASYTVPEDVATIAEEGFARNGHIVNLTLPSTLSTLGTGAFSGCISLAAAVLPDGITRVPVSAYANCTALASVVFPAGLTFIGDESFLACTSLTTVTIPASVTALRIHAFFSCSSLASAYFKGDKPAEFGVWALPATTRIYYYTGAAGFTTPTWNGYNTTAAAAPEFTYTVSGAGTATITGHGVPVGDLTIPTTIGGHLVVAVGINAFQNRTGLTSITIPTGVTSIGNNAFNGCTGLTTVVIEGTSVTFGTDVFTGCTNLVSYTGPAPTVTNGFTLLLHPSYASTETALPANGYVPQISFELSGLTAYSGGGGDGSTTSGDKVVAGGGGGAGNATVVTINIT